MTKLEEQKAELLKDINTLHDGWRVVLFQRDVLLQVLKDVINGGDDAIECAKAAVNAIEGRDIDTPPNP